MRNYKREYETRIERSKRLHADLDRAKVETLQRKLKSDGRTYANWLDEQIDKAFQEWDLNFNSDTIPTKRA